MKTEIRAVPHSTTPGATVLELWYDGLFVGAVYGADGPGVRIISKYSKDTQATPQVVEVRINPAILE